ncbi:MAG: glycosyltransferase family 2 protein [Flavobacteriaceae bacterium]|nr:glycosyltransferase family 2 protein [Flavobacteriaceae bacterium]
MPSLSVVIITLNEERNIARCLESLKGVADEVVVLDSFSDDRTEEICRQHGVTFFQHSFDGHVEQKNRVLTFANHPLILSLDADEALSAELRDGILQLKEKPTLQGYRMNRLNNYCGQWIRHSGWYPDTKLRMWQRDAGHWAGENPHDRFELKVDSSIGFLKGNLLHYSYSTVAEHFAQAEKFSTIAAITLFEKGITASPLMPVLKAVAKFLRNYILRLGFIDGKNGLTICRITAWETLMKYQKLRALHKKARK